MEISRDIESLRPGHEFRAQLMGERDFCLASLISQLVGRRNAAIDREADIFLIEAVNDAIVSSNEIVGEYELACQIPGCDTRCTVTRTPGANGSIEIDDPQELLSCIYE